MAFPLFQEDVICRDVNSDKSVIQQASPCIFNRDRNEGYTSHHNGYPEKIISSHTTK